jgi:hypothetical protein
MSGIEDIGILTANKFARVAFPPRFEKRGYQSPAYLACGWVNGKKFYAIDRYQRRLYNNYLNPTLTRR